MTRQQQIENLIGRLETDHPRAFDLINDFANDLCLEQAEIAAAHHVNKDADRLESIRDLLIEERATRSDAHVELRASLTLLETLTHRLRDLSQNIDPATEREYQAYLDEAIS